MNAWEQRKFGGIINRISKQSDSDSLPKVEFEDIVSGEGRLNKDITNKFDNRKGTVFEPENILYGKLRPYLKNWLYTDFKGIALGDFWVFESISTVPIFNYYLIQAEKYQEVANMSTGTKMPRSDWKIVSEADFSIPSNIKEQEKLGKFFSTLDTTITLHQRKLEKMRELKKAYLQVMFPKEGERVPKLRFRGFEEKWEQFKLGSVLEKNTEKNKNLEFSNVESVSNKYGFVRQSEYFEDREIASKDTSNYYVIRKGAFAYNPSRINVGSIGMKHDVNISIVSPLYVSFYPKLALNQMFLWNWFKVEEFEKQRQLLTAGGVRDTLSYEALREMTISIPNEKEQEKIGELINQIENSISMSQKKLESLQLLKNAYLQKMFV